MTQPEMLLAVLDAMPAEFRLEDFIVAAEWGRCSRDSAKLSWLAQAGYVLLGAPSQRNQHS